MAAKKPKESQSYTEQKPEQTLLFIKPKKVEESDLPSPPLDEVKPPLPKPTKRPSPPPSDPNTPADLPLNAVFKAVGIVVGIVNFNEKFATLTIGVHQYPLRFSPKHKKAWSALKKQSQNNPGQLERLIVYPRIMHFPKREILHVVSFQLVGFDSDKTVKGITKELQDFEFTLCGLWQFIPVCQTPCISIFKNFKQERLDWIKEKEAFKRVGYMKPTHIPVIWKDAPIRPFRFNPKVEKDKQGTATFVEIVARFIPGRDVFGFVKMLSTPLEKCPRFLKARKEDKMEAIKTKLIFDREKDALNSKKTVWGKPKKKER